MQNNGGAAERSKGPAGFPALPVVPAAAGVPAAVARAAGGISASISMEELKFTTAVPLDYLNWST